MLVAVLPRWWQKIFADFEENESVASIAREMPAAGDSGVATEAPRLAARSAPPSRVFLGSRGKRDSGARDVNPTNALGKGRQDVSSRAQAARHGLGACGIWLARLVRPTRGPLASSRACSQPSAERHWWRTRSLVFRSLRHSWRRILRSAGFRNCSSAGASRPRMARGGHWATRCCRLGWVWDVGGVAGLRSPGARARGRHQVGFPTGGGPSCCASSGRSSASGSAWRTSENASERRGHLTVTVDRCRPVGRLVSRRHSLCGGDSRVDG